MPYMRRSPFLRSVPQCVTTACVFATVLSVGCRRKAEIAPESVRAVPQVSPVTPRRVTFSPTEPSRLLVIELTGLVGLWDVADIAKPELTTSFPASAIEAVFTPDGRTVLTVGP